MEITNKINVLCKIAKILNDNKITWCVGASLLLFFKEKVETFNDIDIMVIEQDVDVLKKALSCIGSLKPPNPSKKYKTKYFLEFEIDGVEVDVMANFVIVSNNIEYDCSLKKEDITEHIIIKCQSVPLHSLQLWKKYYTLMGRSDKVKILDE